VTTTELPWRGDPAEIVAAFDRDHVHRRFAASMADAAPAWHERAACAGVGLEVFFPTLGQSGAAAKRICAGCSVRTECLAEALADPELDHGVRGGLSARERTRLRGRTFGRSRRSAP
jgi:WhiB family redox-sensing transcriptional regulator